MHYEMAMSSGQLGKISKINVQSKIRHGLITMVDLFNFS